MKMVFVHNSFELAISAHTDREQTSRSQVCIKQPCKTIDPENRAKPIRIQRHDQIETSHGKRDTEDHNKKRRKKTILEGKPKISGRILSQGVRDHLSTHKNPKPDRDKIADHEKT